MKYMNIVKKHASKATLAVGASVLSFGALADTTSNPIKQQIEAAVSSATDNYGLVIAGVIALCAMGFGLARITGVMK
jgi:hypothetical protein